MKTLFLRQENSVYKNKITYRCLKERDFIFFQITQINVSHLLTKAQYAPAGKESSAAVCGYKKILSLNRLKCTRHHLLQLPKGSWNIPFPKKTDVTFLCNL